MGENLNPAAPLYSVQEAFDRMVLGIRKQGRAAVFGDACQLRCESVAGPDLACALGQLIPDADYHSGMEPEPRTYARQYIAADFSKGFIENEEELDDFLAAMQDAHDDAWGASNDPEDSFLDGFLRAARDVAQDYQLDPTCLEKPL